MGKKDPRVDEYIARSAGFAKPILNHLRKTVHRGCPEVEETLKWRFPHFMYKGMLCSMASFKEHCAFGFWKGKLIVGNDDAKYEQAMGQFGRITSLADLPKAKILNQYVTEAVRLNDEGIKLFRPPNRKAKKALKIPGYLAAVLRSNGKASATFKTFSPSHRNEYIEWLSEAKTEETRQKRLETAIEWLTEGKVRNWKYLKK